MDKKLIKKIKRLSKSDVSASTIADKLNLSVSSVAKLRKNLNLPRPTASRFNKVDRNQLRKLVKQGHTYAELGEKLGFAGETLCRIAVNELGIRRHTTYNNSLSNEKNK